MKIGGKVVIDEMNKTAEWWINECGGVFCSDCGLYYDDYYEAAPNQCPKCNKKMYANSENYVHKNFRLSSLYSCEYKDESEYPQWLLELRNKYMSNT